jgi:predicted enzyme related to lactoylglutathione lyase
MPQAKDFYKEGFGRTLMRLESPDLEMKTFGMNRQTVGAGGAADEMEGVAPGGNGSPPGLACPDRTPPQCRTGAAGGHVF